MMSLHKYLIKAKNAHSNLDYDASRRNIEFVIEGISSETISSSEGEILLDDVLDILLQIEPVHYEYIKEAQSNGKFLRSYHFILKSIKDLINTLHDQGHRHIYELLEGFIYYINRDLSNALEVLSDEIDDKYLMNHHYMYLKGQILYLEDMLEQSIKYLKIAKKVSDDNSEICDYLKKVEFQLSTSPKTRIISGRWPAEMIEESSLVEFVEKNILTGNKVANKIASPQNKIVTMGSCFAVNIANSLKKQNIDAYAFPFGEEINSTPANNLILKTLLSGNLRGMHQILGDQFSEKQAKEFSKKISMADIFILTLGVSQALFSLKTDNPIMLKGLGGVNRNALKTGYFKRITVEENAHNILEILSLIKEFQPQIKLVLTISPVPLSRTFGSKSAVMDDCLSKSTLRVAAEQIMSKQKDVFYWPSFEIVKWIAPHVRYPEPFTHFGFDDNYSRHASEKIIDLNMSLFKKYALMETIS